MTVFQRGSGGALMQSQITDLVLAFQLHQITPSEFADALLLLPRGEAQIALRVLSNLWGRDAAREAEGQRARDLQRVLRMSGLPLN